MRLLVLLCLFGVVRCRSDWIVDDRCLLLENEDSLAFVETEDTGEPDAPVADQSSFLRGSTIQETDFRFNLKLYWEQGYCWQSEWIERRWCMECRGAWCSLNDYLEIQECKNLNNQEFTWQPVAGTGGGRLKVFDRDLCLERVGENDFNMQRCNGNITQVMVGFDATAPFELHAYGQVGKCFTQLHHPKPLEEMITRPCHLAERSNTNLWQVIYPQGSYGGIDFGYESADPSLAPVSLAPATPSPATPAPATPAPVTPAPATSSNVLRYRGSCGVNSPCGKCVGDCNSDDDCQGTLKCFHRTNSNPFEAVPGCQGTGGRLTDFCYDATRLRAAGSCTVDSPCEECEGDCNADNQCGGDLKCYHRTNSNPYDPVPGCTGTGYRLTDYCYNTEIATRI